MAAVRKNRAPLRTRTTVRSSEDEARAFVADLVARGEVVPAPAEGEDLPSGVTHTIEPAAEGEARVLVRRRFSAS